LKPIDKIIIAATLLVLTGCASDSSVHAFGDTVDLSHFQGVVEINIDAIASGELKDDSMLRLNVEEGIAKALREKYKSMGSYSVFLITASKEELKMTNHRALRDRGYTHLLVTAINPEQTRDGNHSMNISCTVYRLSDGMPMSLVNADVYAIDKDYWGRDASKRSGAISERWQLGAIYSCDQALKAVTG
jgi:hypothetical protein